MPPALGAVEQRHEAAPPELAPMTGDGRVTPTVNEITYNYWLSRASSGQASAAPARTEMPELQAARLSSDTGGLGGAGTSDAAQGDGTAPAVVLQAGGADEEAVLREAWSDGGFTPFYSYNTPNNDLSSMSTDYGFEARAEGFRQPSDDWLRGQHVGRYFKSREHFFQFTKCMYATGGMHKTAALTLAEELMCMPAMDTKRATQAPGKRSRLGGEGGLRGLERAAWERDRVSVMLQATRQQAEGCPDFRARLQETGTTLLAEASEKDGFWGIGMKAEAAARTPQSERRRVFGKNKAGVVLMIIRAEGRINAERGFAAGWRTHGSRTTAGDGGQGSA